MIFADIKNMEWASQGRKRHWQDPAHCGDSCSLYLNAKFKNKIKYFLWH